MLPTCTISLLLDVLKQVLEEAILSTTEDQPNYFSLLDRDLNIYELNLRRIERALEKLYK